jgi:hypothetical protein
MIKQHISKLQKQHDSAVDTNVGQQRRNINSNACELQCKNIPWTCNGVSDFPIFTRCAKYPKISTACNHDDYNVPAEQKSLNTTKLKSVTEYWTSSIHLLSAQSVSPCEKHPVRWGSRATYRFTRYIYTSFIGSPGIFIHHLSVHPEYLYVAYRFIRNIYTSLIGSSGIFIRRLSVHLEYLYATYRFTRNIYTSLIGSSGIFIRHLSVHPEYLFATYRFTRNIYMSLIGSSGIFIHHLSVHPEYLYVAYRFIRNIYTPLIGSPGIFIRRLSVHPVQWVSVGTKK